VAGADKEVACSDFQSYLQGMENVEHQVRHLILARADHGFTAPPQQKLNIDRVVDFFSSMKALVSAESDL
ncbi:MAG: hypothetical protein O7G85_03905, partial [Planctomycetota bacterium]|nr:hypothetical protein [Planctomycetota bacterium]